jgi:hypothetical protein
LKILSIFISFKKYLEIYVELDLSVLNFDIFDYFKLAKMKKLVYFLFLFGGSYISKSQNINNETLIKQATLALPEEEREGATVLGLDEKGNSIVLKKGTNQQICIADDPKNGGFNVSCYHESLEPFMARGRELKKENKSFKEVFDIREAEAKSGKIKMPEKPATLHILTGETAEKANYRYVVYIPWATAASTGLPTKPIVAGGPWIMDPGTHRAHIMISVPSQK